MLPLSLVLVTLLSITPLGVVAAPLPAVSSANVNATAAQGTLPSCSWNRPGHNPFMGDVVAAVDRYPDIPAPVRARLKARMAARQYDEIVSIRREAIVGRARYGSEIRDMHFGTGQVCGAVSRAQWTPANQERGLVYCEAGHCILVPTVCRNVSRIDRVGPAVAATEPEASGGMAGGGGGGGGGAGVVAGTAVGVSDAAPAASPAAPAEQASQGSFVDVSATGAATGLGLVGGGPTSSPAGGSVGASGASDGLGGLASGRGSWQSAAGLSGPLSPFGTSAGTIGQPQVGDRPQVALNAPLPGESLPGGPVPGGEGLGQGGPIPDLGGDPTTHAAPMLAVPEPGSWALMLLGLLAVSGRARRRG